MRTDSTVRHIAKTVVAVLREPTLDALCPRLTSLQLKEWESGYHWLDANGLALYFRHVLRANQLDTCVPREMLARLDRNYIDNQSRLEQQLVEFREINLHLQNAGIRYANLKGFTLEPDYCSDLRLRYQCDLDFMVRRADGSSFRAVLEKLGYRLTVEEAETLEFKPPEDHLPDIEDLYKPRRRHGVEVHFGSSTRKLDLREDCLDQIVWIDRFGTRFPLLGELDQFFSLVFHLYRHLLSEWVRLSWFYELGWFLQHRVSDQAFWCAVLERAEADQETAQALALVMAFSEHAFTGPLPEHVVELCSKNLSKSTRLWIGHYGPEMLFSDFPGNKLYLLLMREIGMHQNDCRELSRKRLLPFHPPARALFGDSRTEQIRNIPGNTRYALSRARFHAREGLRYLKEQWRWKRTMAQTALLESGSE